MTAEILKELLESTEVIAADALGDGAYFADAGYTDEDQAAIDAALDALLGL